MMATSVPSAVVLGLSRSQPAIKTQRMAIYGNIVLKYGPSYPVYQRPEQISAASLGSIQQSSTRRVRTIYMCDAENESELSFEPNQIITNVRASREPGWLEGTLNGKTGLVPENYVEYLQ
ncbi:PREDICTED: rho GTPase-activating protein 26-like isoform X1 [Priapulus caudatus]|uniref:Rho GTPase-activating protein 26-like isoform X1 n=1 Tax=Priapulus caudatus TaxID=37621 RepID=A0ABM1F002_PRICU|nr:PREDICTED: rho GTPase-activating protein 26-like isoform X1 [Priapulus caudatus]